MANTILILGNGFDIAMGRKTKYTDFVEFEKQLFSNPDEKLQEFLQAKSISIEKYKDNLYLKFITENKDTLGDNWSNLEIMISQLADAIMYFKENMKLLYDSSDIHPIRKSRDSLKNETNFSAKYFIVEVFAPLYSHYEWKFLDRDLVLNKLNYIFIEQLNLLTELLEIYLSYLDYLDFDIQRLEASLTALDAISDLSNSSVLNFNYTNTSGHLYGTSEKKTHFIHGRIDLDRTFSRINTMVFGIEDKEINVNSDLIPYQKYYQRVVKETGKKFEDFFCIRNLKKRDIPGSNLQTIQGTSKNIVVFGHSVDPLDKEIFQKCFELTITRKYNSRFIFTYFDEQAKRSIIKNLAIILGKEKLIELTGKQKIVFIKSDDKDGMKDALLP